MKAVKPKMLTLQEKEQIKALSAAGWTVHAIARETGRDDHTVKNYIQTPEAARDIEQIKSELSQMFEGLSRRLLESITSEDIGKINAYQRVIAASAATDKMRLLRGESTANLSVRSVVEQIEADRRQIMAEIIDLKAEIDAQG